MNENPQVDLEDAAEFFRQGEDAAAESRRLANHAFVEDALDKPDPTLVEQQLKRRARYTRWVVALMGTLSVGCLVVFSAQWLKGGDQHAEIEILQDDTASSRTAESAPKRAGPVQTTHSLRPADPSTRRLPPPKPAPAHEKTQEARATGATLAAAARKDGTSATPPPAQGSPKSRPPAVAARAVASPRPSPRRAVASSSTARSKSAPRSRAPRAQRARETAVRRARVPAVVVSRTKTQGWKAGYRPPTARFED